MPSVRGVDPHGVVVHVDVAAVAVVGEGRAAVAGLVEPGACDVDEALIARVHADLAVVHRARVERVDALPRGAAILGLEDAAVLVPVGTLFVLCVGALPAEPDAKRAIAQATVYVEALLLLLGLTVERDLHLHQLAVADRLDLRGVAGHVVAQHAAQPRLVQDRGIRDAEDDVALLHAGRRGRGVLGDRADPGAELGALEGDAEPGRVLGLLGDLVGLDHGEEVVRLGRRPAQADPAQLGGGEALAEPLPRRAAVRGPVEARAVAPLHSGVVGVEHVAASLVARDDDRVRVHGVHLHLDDARVLVHEEHALPGEPAVRGLVDAALVVRTPEAAEGADVDHVGVLRVHDDGADLEGLAEAGVAPGGAAVLGDVDAVTPGDRVAGVVLAGARPDLGGVRGGDGESAHRGGALVGELVLVGDAVVGRVEHAAGRGGDPILRGVRGVDRDVRDAAAHVRRPDGAPLQGVDPVEGEGALHLGGAALRELTLGLFSVGALLGDRFGDGEALGDGLFLGRGAGERGAEQGNGQGRGGQAKEWRVRPGEGADVEGDVGEHHVVGELGRPRERGMRP